MNQNEFGKLIKEIRKKNNLTQKELADRYNVTYQAVSKWENGKNMPDISLIKEISRDFNVSMDDLLRGNYNTKKNNYISLIAASVFLMMTIILIIIIVYKQDSNFKFRTLSSNCDNFNISGSISYNRNKSAIYVTNITYCGEEDNARYKKIECILYEKEKNISTEVSSYVYEKEITLSEFLKKVTLSTDSYSKICTNYNENSLYLEIKCTNNNNIITTYVIPLSLKNECEVAENE